jgi:hypothetical protein
VTRIEVELRVLFAPAPVVGIEIGTEIAAIGTGAEIVACELEMASRLAVSSSSPYTFLEGPPI